ncbi:glycosyltransferase [Pontibacter sp. H259]|uniref:glycosyltransferase family 2 protein n=1 Tax=Pontibacter sp. H259 TaxID=3133421 RepID=UPI0030BB28E5
MKCSVIVANYNNAATLQQALQSVEQQTYTNCEVIFVDDASTDDSVAVFERWRLSVADKTKYKLVVLEQNKGVGNAKRTAISGSNGEFIFILDADDALAPTALEDFVTAHAQYPSASLIYSTYYKCDGDLLPKEIEPNTRQVQFSDLLEDSISHLVSFKRQYYNLTEGFDSSFKLSEDKDLYYKLEEVGDVVFINQPLYNYRIWNKGISQGFDNYVKSRNYKLTAIDNALKRRKESRIKLPTKTQIHKLLAEIHLLQAEGLVYSQQPLGSKFLKHLGLAILYNPTASIIRKLKAVFVLSRAKRSINRWLS